MIKHLAIIMDGNRRWAKKNSLMPWLGHKSGVETVKKTIGFCLKNKIEYLSLYTFSIENFKRSELEVSYLFNLLIDQALNSLEFLVENKIRVKFVGDRSLFPDSVIKSCEKIETETLSCSQLYLNILFCYSGQREIIDGVKSVIDLINKKNLDIKDLDEQSFGKILWAGDVPSPELVIRTGGMRRLSNFLLYHIAYSELYFLDKLWPEITDEDLVQALDFFENSKRNFGA